MQQPGAAPRPGRRRRLLGALAAAAVVALGIGVLRDDPAGVSDPVPAPAPPASAAAALAGSGAAAPGPPGFGDGTHLVGTEMPPGLYRTEGAGLCSWQRLSDLSGKYSAVLAWEFVEGQTYVEVLPSDAAFATDDCGRWTPATGGGPDVSSGFGDGTYLVGSDVRPGTYRSTGGVNCSWARLSGLTGDFGDVRAVAFSDEETRVVIQPSDAAFRTDGCGTWTRIG